MLYGIETLAFNCLIEYDVSKLPVDVVQVAKRMKCIVSSYLEAHDLIVELEMEEYCKTHDAASVVYKGQRYILISGALGYERKHYAIAHEIGHMKMHYDISGTILGQTENPEERAKQELEADTFALALLAPAPVLHKIGATSTEQIARITLLESAHASKVRDKISTLELTSKDDPMYQPLCNQFSGFIKRYSAKEEKQRTFSPSYIFQAIFALSFAALVVLIFTARPATQPATSSLVELTTSQEIESASTSDNVSVASQAAATSSKPAAPAASSKPAASTRKTVYYVQPMPIISTATVIPKVSSSRASSATPAVTAPKSGAQVYYWTAGGDKYHIDPNCYSIQNTKYPVQSGSLQDAYDNGKKEPCKNCTDKS